jgi:acyl-CoA synthetase (AMP-forming)/AMP-acid ligase II
MPGAIRHAAEAFGDREFVVMPDRRMTYAMAESASRRVGKELLAGGAGKGTRIGMMYSYGSDWIVAWLAITRIGAICMPFSTSYKPAELRKSLRHGDVDTLLVPATLFGRDWEAYLEETIPGLAENTGGPLRVTELPYLRRILVTGGAKAPWAHSLSLAFEGPEATDTDAVSEELFEAVEAEVSPADLFMTIFTSGTTSDPKGVVHTHGNFLRHGANLAAFQDVSPDERTFCGMPFFWIGGVGCTLNFALARGNTLLCIERFEPDAALDMMEAEKATTLSMWGQLAQKLRQRIAAQGRDVSGIPIFAAPPPGTPTTDDPELRHNSMGMTETVGPHSGAGPEAGRVLPEEMRGSFGLLVPYVEHRVADPETNATLPEGEIGELCIRGYSVMNGLYKKERYETFDDDGWYHTGDKGYLRDGYLYYLGRLSEMIKTSGSNVAPREVEVLLETFPEVGLAVVLGIPDPDRGEVVGAVLIPAPGMVLDADDVLERLSKEVSSFKVPTKVLVLADEELPSLASGKPDKVNLRQRLAAL